ncbi:unnamed protein product [Caenorhabditis bovis]|uniref:Uncharacterized protein n=1 Tax=Caenorhabditis bovis TaxID=2654633 RepID=A0A8S1EF91_9PELO|nr:unnamed protein product [Caenorhabditis bovis]
MKSTSIFVLFFVVAVAFCAVGTVKKPLLDVANMPVNYPNCVPDEYGTPSIPCPGPPKKADSEWPCVRYVDLCNMRIDCPNGEDESVQLCFYHNAVRKAHIQRLYQRIDNLRGL